MGSWSGSGVMNSSIWSNDLPKWETLESGSIPKSDYPVRHPPCIGKQYWRVKPFLYLRCYLHLDGLSDLSIWLAIWHLSKGRKAFFVFCWWKGGVKKRREIGVKFLSLLKRCCSVGYLLHLKTVFVKPFPILLSQFSEREQKGIVQVFFTW